MKLLLDTHALLWYLTTPEKLPAAAHRAIQAAENDVYASLASAWEIAIKVSIGKLDFDTQGLEQALPAVGVEALGISLQHAARAFRRIIAIHSTACWSRRRCAIP